MIVQGCAGSGKSMIMMHRLPIMLYDNERLLSRKNIFVITPSTAYIQLMNNMLIDLEIDDLPMGTIKSYYDLLLSRYTSRKADYGEILNEPPLEEKFSPYIYSSQCMDDIREEIMLRIEKTAVDYKPAHAAFRIKENIVEDVTIPRRLVTTRMREMQRAINANTTSLRGYQKCIRQLMSDVEDVVSFLNNRRESVKRELESRELRITDQLGALRGEIETLDKNSNRVAFERRMTGIEQTQKMLGEIAKKREAFENDDNYFLQLKNLGTEIEKRIKLYSFVMGEYEDISNDLLYHLIESRGEFCDFFTQIFDAIGRMEEHYEGYGASIKEMASKTKNSIKKYKEYDEVFLEPLYYKKIVWSVNQFVALDRDIVDQIYAGIMANIERMKGKSGKAEGLSFSPYVYLLITFLYEGAPNAASDNLIMVDEAQNLAPLELDFIQQVNNNQVVFNLFGDVYQHIEHEKGVSRWEEYRSIKNYKVYRMDENYRNASQITAFCNAQFAMDMRPINLPGNGVHQIKNWEECKKELYKLFQNAQQYGLKAIIVKTVAECAMICNVILADKKSMINNITNAGKSISQSKWNILLVSQTKGLEFKCVFVLSGAMIDNEKYIAYTRALDELYVYDGEMDDEIGNKEIVNPTIVGSESEDQSETKKRKVVKKKKRIKKDNANLPPVKAFIEKYGGSCIDRRSSGGYLWVLGTKEEVGGLIEAVSLKYGVSFLYSSGTKETRYQPAWGTNSEK